MFPSFRSISLAGAKGKAHVASAQSIRLVSFPPMKSPIQFYSRSAYGVARLYIVSPSQADTVATLTRRKTVESADLLALQSLGCTVEQVPDPKAWLAPSNLSALRQS